MLSILPTEKQSLDMVWGTWSLTKSPTAKEVDLFIWKILLYVMDNPAKINFPYMLFKDQLPLRIPLS